MILSRTTFNIYNWFRIKRCLPIMTNQEVEIIKRLLLSIGRRKGFIRVFEYGSGASTVYFSNLIFKAGIPFMWVSVDNDEKWNNKIKKLSGKHRILPDGGYDPGYKIAAHYIRLFLYKFKPTFKSPNLPEEFAYINSINTIVFVYEKDTLDPGKYDFILIDGRFRRRCIIEAKKHLAPGGTLVLHDAHRDYYGCSISGGRVISSRYYPTSFISKIWVYNEGCQQLTFVMIA